LVEIARTRGVTEAEVALAWLLGLGEHVVAIPGARTAETARSAARAGSLELTRDESARIAPSRPPARRAATHGDIVLVMGVPGAGKSRLAGDYVDRGYVRLNRDERGGSLRELAGALDLALADGSREVVLDNTYLTRASRSYVVEAAGRHGVAARCIWLDAPLAQAQVNLVERLLDRFGELPTPARLKAIAQVEPGLLTPTQQMRTFRELEPPAEDEGFASVEHIAFARDPGTGTAGVFVAAAAIGALPLADVDHGVPHLVFDWRPGGGGADLAAAVAVAARTVSGSLEAAICPHPGGPPICWCRPPLPGLLLAFARAHGVDPAHSLVIGASTAHRTLANALGATYVET
ncbi:MAG: aldo/keto reductase, partial [Gaiellaceae bacterium]